MQITFDSNKDDLTEVIKTVKFLQNYKLENKAPVVLTGADSSEETSADPSPLSVTQPVSSDAFGAPKKRGRKPKTQNVEGLDTATGEYKTVLTPLETAIAATQPSQPVAAPSVFATAPAPAQVETPVYTAQQFYQIIVDLNKAGTFNPNTDMEGFCGEISALVGKKVSNIVEITSDSAVIQAAIQVLKNHKLI